LEWNLPTTAHSSKKQLTGSGGLKVTVVTPVGAIAKQSSEAVTAPGALGEFEVFPGHVPFLTKLHAGVLKLGENVNQIVYAVGPGLLEVDRDGTVRILVEKAIVANKVDVESARVELETIEPVLKEWKGPTGAEWLNAKARYDWAKAQLDAARGLR
jgi:F-type H+-transporting ATPase subunit epsilon